MLACSLLVAVAMKTLRHWSQLPLVLAICACGGEMQDDELTTQGADNVAAAEAGGASSVATAGVVGVTTGGSAEETSAPAAICVAQRTTEIRIAGNLDSSSWIPVFGWNVLQPLNTSNFSDTITLFDGTETSITCDVYFRKEAENVWSYHVLFNTETAPVECGTGELQFDTKGALLRRLEFSPPRFPETSESSGVPLVLDLGSPKVAGSSGLDGLIQQPKPSNIKGHWQDGHPEDTEEFCRALEQQAAGG
jgi:hypothetical protein